MTLQASVQLSVGLLLCGVFFALGRSQQRSEGGSARQGYLGLATAQALLLIGTISAAGGGAYAVWSILATLVAVVAVIRLPIPASELPNQKYLQQFLIGSGAITSIYLVLSLGTWIGTAATWETEVFEGFWREFTRSQSINAALLNRLVVGQGVVSSSYDTLLFGFPTYWLLTRVGFSLEALRTSSLFFSGLSVWLIYKLSARLGFAESRGLIAWMLLIAPGTLYYSRYGIALTATLAGVLAAIILTDRFITKQKLSGLDGCLCCLSLAIASLGYAVGRLVVVFLCILILYQFLRPNFKGSRSAWVILVFVFSITAFGIVQYLLGGAQRFIHARGEQIAHFIVDPSYQRDFLGINQNTADSTSVVRIAGAVLSKTVPEFLQIISPLSPNMIINGGVAAIGDPPLLPLYFGVLLPCILLGFKESMTSQFISRRVILLGVGCSVLLPLLGTTRVDFHRAFLALIPLTIWGGVGIIRVAKSVSVKWPKRAALFLPLIALGIWVESARLLWPNISESTPISGLIEEVELAPLPLKIGYAGAHTDWTALSIAIAKRSQSEGTKKISFLARAIISDLSSGTSGAEAEKQRFKELVKQLRESPEVPLLLIPENKFGEGAKRFRAENLSVEPVIFGGTPGLKIIPLAEP